MRSKNKVIYYALLFGIILYFIDSLVYYLVFKSDAGFLEILVTDVPLSELYRRLISFLGLIIFAFVVSSEISDLSIENDFLKKEPAGSKEFNQDKELLSNLSYQIRTPLNAIVGFTELLKDPNISVQSKQTYIDHIQSSGNYLLQLITNLINISKIEENEVPLQKTEFDLNILMEDLKKFFNEKKKMLGKGEIEFKIAKSKSTNGLVISTDRGRLWEILVNLVENALKHTFSGYVEVSLNLKENNLIEFSVKDTGQGYSEGRLETIFERYKKLTDNYNLPFDGTALRLGITKSLVKLLGGNIWAHSKSDSGSVFYFTLPFGTAEQNEIPVPSVESEIKGEKKKQKNWPDKLILIAEDVESNFIYLQELLKPTGARLIWAENGKAAVERVKENLQIDLVLLDILMPEMDGYEASRLLKELRPELPIIAQTAYVSDEEQNEDKHQNFDSYLIKPIWSMQLFDTISKYLD